MIEFVRTLKARWFSAWFFYFSFAVFYSRKCIYKLYSLCMLPINTVLWFFLFFFFFFSLILYLPLFNVHVFNVFSVVVLHLMIYVILAQQTVAERDAIVRKWVEYDARNAGFLEFNFNIISVKSPTHTHTHTRYTRTMEMSLMNQFNDGFWRKWVQCDNADENPDLGFLL